MENHLLNKLKIGETALCPCEAANQITVHLLQDCTLHTDLRSDCWRETTPLAIKLYDGLEDLRCTAAFVTRTGVSVQANEKKKKKNRQLCNEQEKHCS